MGAGADVQYTNQRFSFLAGPALAFKLKTASIEKLQSSIFNYQLLLQNYWGTDKQILIGTGFRIEIGQMILASLLAYRDVHLNYWKFQVGLGFNLFKGPKIPIHSNDDPSEEIPLNNHN